MFGFINIFKPKGMTSHDVVSRLRRVSKIKQIGHTGTLDPLAEGVLPVAVGKASRLIEYLQEDKAYIADLLFGKISDTYDVEGIVEDYSDVKVSKESLLNAINNFKGEIEQIPPAYSAVHYNGRRLYELAREGIIPDDIPKRNVFVSKIELLEFDYSKQTAKLEIACSKGTYIRSIVHDLGMNLGSGAVMTDLLRTKSGAFSLDSAVNPDELIEPVDVSGRLINPVEVLSYKCYELSQSEFEKIKHGQALNTSMFAQDELVSLIYNGSLCAIALKKNELLNVKKVFIQ